MATDEEELEKEDNELTNKMAQGEAIDLNQLGYDYEYQIDLYKMALEKARKEGALAEREKWKNAIGKIGCGYEWEEYIGHNDSTYAICGIIRNDMNPPQALFCSKCREKKRILEKLKEQGVNLK